jgi:predicted RNA-binding protein Jag
MAGHQARMMDASQPFISFWHAVDPLRHTSNTLLDMGTYRSRRADAAQKAARRAASAAAPAAEA